MEGGDKHLHRVFQLCFEEFLIFVVGVDPKMLGEEFRRELRKDLLEDKKSFCKNL